MKNLLIILLSVVLSSALIGCSSTKNDSENTNETQSSSNAPVDKSELQAEIESQTEYDPNGYPEEQYNNWVEALNNANSVMNDNSATQDEVDDATYDLENSVYNLVNATDKDHPKKFDYEWYKSGQFHARDGAWTVMACVITNSFTNNNEEYYVATVANDDATLSDVDVLILPSTTGVEDGLSVGDVITLLGTTDEMTQVTIGKTYQKNLPSINPVEIQIAE